MSVLIVYPDAGSGNTTVDGQVTEGTDDTHTNMRNDTGNGSDDTDTSEQFMQTRTGSTSNKFTELSWSIFTFDTSPLTVDAVISSADFSLVVTLKNNELGSPSYHVIETEPASNNALVDSDYSTFGTTSFSSIDYADIDTNVYTDWSLNSSGILNIDKVGISKFGVVDSWFLNDNFTGVWGSSDSTNITGRFSDYAGTSVDPKLTITYSTGSTFKPKILWT